MAKVVLPIVFLLVLSLASLFAVKKFLLDPHESQHPSLDVGTSATDLEFFSFPMNGSVQARTLSKKLYVVNFWATWCTACLIEIPSLIKMRERFRSKGVELFLVSVDENPAEVLPPMLKKLKIDFMTYYDKDQKLAETFDVTGIPVTYILDSQLKVLAAEVGEKDWDSKAVQMKIESWL